MSLWKVKNPKGPDFYVSAAGPSMALHAALEVLDLRMSGATRHGRTSIQLMTQADQVYVEKDAVTEIYDRGLR